MIEAIDWKRTKDRLKNNLILRTLAYPYKSYVIKKEYNAYIHSEEPEKIRKFKDCNVGKRCFVLGNGPSLRIDDLNKLQNEVTMAVNRIYNTFDKTDWRPTYYFFVDNRGSREFLPIIEKLDIDYKFVTFEAKKYAMQDQNILYINSIGKRYVIFKFNDKTSHISEDVSQYFSVGYSVPFTAVQFAIYTGIKEIYLLGIDFDYSHVLDKWGRETVIEGVEDYFYENIYTGSYLVYYSVLKACNAAKKYCDTHGIKIYNATRGGKLEVFERVDFDSIFEKDNKKDIIQGEYINV